MIDSNVILGILDHFKENLHFLLLSSDTTRGWHRSLRLSAQSHEVASTAGPRAGSQPSLILCPICLQTEDLGIALSGQKCVRMAGGTQEKSLPTRPSVLTLLR